MTGTAVRMMEGTFATVNAEVKERCIWFLIVGIVMVVLGIAAIAFPFIATIGVELLIGWILVISGVVGIVHAFRSAKWKGFLFSLLGALLSLGVGIVLLLYPFKGILSLTLLIAAFFLAGGVFRILLALRLRPADHWAWLLASGILALVLAVLTLAQWPAAAAWMMGLLIGIDRIFAGWTSIMLAMAGPRSA